MSNDWKWSLLIIALNIFLYREIYMDKIMMWIMAICALIGGTDRLLGNRLGLGKRSEDGFQLLGPTALSMAGLICITPLVSLGLEYTIVPFYRMLHLDQVCWVGF